METRFTRLVGCSLPLQQAGMGETATVELAVAVAETGALGMLGLAGQRPAAVAAATAAAKKRTNGALGANFLVPFLDTRAVEAAAGNVRVLEFFYGEPDPAVVALAHEAGALVSWQVGSVAEAKAAADAGCDLVVAQGVEAGGHVRGTTALLPLLDAVLDVVSVPVLGAGGIGSPRTVAAVLGAGADGVRVGTRFLAAEEADVHPAYLDALIAAGADDTVLTDTFSYGWAAPHRVLRGCVDTALELSDDVVGDANGAPVPRLSAAPPTHATQGRVDAMALYAGQAVAHVARRQPAREIVCELMGPIA